MVFGMLGVYKTLYALHSYKKKKRCCFLELDLSWSTILYSHSVINLTLIKSVVCLSLIIYLQKRLFFSYRLAMFTPVTTNLGCAPLTHIQLVEVTHSHFKRTKGFFRDLNRITRFNAANIARAWTQSALTIMFVPQGWKILQHSLYIILRQYIIWTSSGLWNGTLRTIVDIVTDVVGL